MQNVMITGSLHQSFAIFHLILQQENYTFWKEDLRHTIIHDLFNRVPGQAGQAATQSISSFILSKLLMLPLTQSCAPSSLCIASPSIQQNIQILHSQPQSISILEKYIVWIVQFCNQAHRRILLTKNEDYFQVIEAFLEQVYIFKDNISQALVNERQIRETIF